MPRCPSCDERVTANETECPHCGESLGDGAPSKVSSKKGKGKAKKSNSSVIVIVLVAVFGIMFVCGGILLALLLPAVQQAREAARRTQCKNNLKQIGLALHNYHDTYMLFPAAHLDDLQGKPKLSWRVSILPYMDEAPRFNRYNFSDAWDGSSNAALLAPSPRTYLCPSYNSAPGSTNTCYATIAGDHTVLGAGKCVSIRDITDGTSNTLMVVEACSLNIPWMKPQDIDENSVGVVGNPNGISSKHTGGAHVLFADGSVRFLSVNVSPQIVDALVTRDGGEQIGGDF